MAKRKYQRYNPIIIEARQSNGEWRVRNKLNNENVAVETGERSREWLMAIAVAKMFAWNNYEQHSKSLRITGGLHG